LQRALYFGDIVVRLSSIHYVQSLSAPCLVELDTISSAFDVNQFLQSVKGCSSQFPLESIRNIRLFLEQRPVGGIQMVLDHKVVPGLLQTLRTQHRIAFLCYGFMRRLVGDRSLHLVQIAFWYLFDLELSLEIAWTLSLLTRGHDAQLRVLVDCDLIPSLLRLFAMSSSTTTKSLALEAMTNLLRPTPPRPIRSDHGHIDRQQIYAVMTRAHLLEFMQREVERMAVNPLHDGLPHFLRKIANSLHILLGVAVPTPPKWQSLRAVTHSLRLLLTAKDGDTLQAACWSMECLAAADDDGYHLLRAHLINSGLVGAAARLLDHKLSTVRLSALKIMGQMAAGTEHQRRYLLELGILELTVPLLLDEEQDMLRGLGCWLVANMVITGTLSETVQHEIFGVVLDRLLFDDYFVAKEAFAAVQRAVSSSTPQQIEAMLSRDVVPAVCSFMTRWVIDHEQMALALLTVDKLLGVGASVLAKRQSAGCIECGGLQFLLEFIASNETPRDLTRTATGIVRRHFTRKQIESEVDEIYLDEPATN